MQATLDAGFEFRFGDTQGNSPEGRPNVLLYSGWSVSGGVGTGNDTPIPMIDANFESLFTNDFAWGVGVGQTYYYDSANPDLTVVTSLFAMGEGLSFSMSNDTSNPPFFANWLAGDVDPSPRDTNTDSSWTGSGMLSYSFDDGSRLSLFHSTFTGRVDGDRSTFNEGNVQGVWRDYPQTQYQRSLNLSRTGLGYRTAEGSKFEPSLRGEPWGQDDIHTAQNLGHSDHDPSRFGPEFRYSPPPPKFGN
jgi:hypothetical protein